MVSDQPLTSSSVGPTPAPTLPPPPSPHKDCTIRFRLTDIDATTSYQSDTQFAQRVSPFYKNRDGSTMLLDSVPLIRLFGATDKGQRVVAHVHGVFPYLYVRYKGKLDPESVNSFIIKFGRKLNQAVHLTFKERHSDPNKPRKAPQHIAFIVICKGTPFYGYAVGHDAFLKVYLTQPSLKKRTADLLRHGAILNTQYDVYEDHIPYLFQFQLDSNLRGCDWVEVSACKFRELPSSDDSAPLLSEGQKGSSTGPFSQRIYDSSTVSFEFRHVNDIPKSSTCTLELDMPVQSILNRRKIEERPLHHDFSERLHPSQTSDEAKLVQALRELWDDEHRRRKAQGKPPPATAPKGMYGPPREYDNYGPESKDWRHSDELAPKLDQRAAESLAELRRALQSPAKEAAYDSWVGDYYSMRAREAGYTDARAYKYWLGQIRTSFEQTDAIYDDRLVKDEEEEYAFGAWAVRGLGVRTWDPPPQGSSQAPVERRVDIPFPGDDDSDDDIDFDVLQATQARMMSQFSASQAQRGANDVALDDLSDDEIDERAIEAAQAEEDDDALQVRQEERDKLFPPGSSEDDYWQLDDDEDDPDLLGPGLEANQGEPIESAEGGREGGEVASVSPQKRQAADDHPISDGHDSDVRTIKQSKQTHSVSDSTLRVRPRPRATPSPSPGPSPRKKNPFASPHKKLRVDTPHNPLAATPRLKEYPSLLDNQVSADDPVSATAGSPSAGSAASFYGGERGRSAEVTADEVARALEDELPEGMFDDVVLTPTQVDPGPQLVPLHRRAAADYETSLPSSPIDIGHADAAPTATKRRVMFDLPDPSPAQSSPVSSVARHSPPPTPTLPSSAFAFTSSLPRARSHHALAPNAFVWAAPAPTTADLLATIVNEVAYPDPFFSKEADVPKVAREFAGERFVLLGSSVKHLPDFRTDQRVGAKQLQGRSRSRSRKTKVWEWNEAPLTRDAAEEWLKAEAEDYSNQVDRASKATVIEGPTQHDGGFKVVSAKGANVTREPQHMQILSIELHINTRAKLFPNPAEDEVAALFYCLKSETDGIEYNGAPKDDSGESDRHVGVVIVGNDQRRRELGITGYIVETVDTEWDLLLWLVDQVQRVWDPECLTGYEVNKGSWGFLVERAKVGHDYDLVDELSRIPTQRARRPYPGQSSLKFVGRHVLPIWSLLRADNKLQHYSFEHVAFHILRVRTPHFSHKTLTKWYNSRYLYKRADVFKYWFRRVQMNIDLLDESEIVAQASESARVFGVDFNSVRTRGSQFKVEAFMVRIAKPESFMLLSPNRAQVARQGAVQEAPLVMEPKSAFYKAPMVVLDFTSLYPSVMCAYNYCYSTCLGRVRHSDRSPNLGVTDYDIPPGLLAAVKDEINISPNGFMFVKEGVRKSLLAKMLTELLETRVMVKASMKGQEGDVPLTKLLNARQLALKFIANVTYGYTTATASGRMPMVELADAIVSTGRETLERAKATIEGHEPWGAKVVYGDTDSLFIYLPGKTKAEAFRIGHAMAAQVTSENPRPVQLKFEKIYLPSVMLAKKRYVGWKYERESDQTAEFDAKGIETVRRDGIVATQKMQESTLKILFRTSDLSLVKDYFQRQCAKILGHRVSPQDFIIAKEVRLGTYSEKGQPPPGAALAARQTLVDPRSEPEYGDRVPYILTQAEPGTKQVDRAVSPEEFLADPRMRLDVVHYITRTIIPPLQRIFSLVGVDLRLWYEEMRKGQRARGLGGEAERVLIEEHFNTTRCLACGGADGDGALCASCQTRPGEVALHLTKEVGWTAKRSRDLRRICASCSGVNAEAEAEECDAIDCPILYDRVATRHELVGQDKLRKALEGLAV